MKKKIIIVLVSLLVFIGIICLFKIPNQIIKTIYKKQYENYVEKYSVEYNVDENLIYSIIKNESKFNKNSKSYKEAIGLMQIMKETAKDVAKEIKIQLSEENLEKELQKPEINIQIGTKYISNLIKKYRNKELAIAAYNAGSGTVDGWIKDGTLQKSGSNIEKIPYKETNNYVRKILRDYKIYSQLN